MIPMVTLDIDWYLVNWHDMESSSVKTPATDFPNWLRILANKDNGHDILKKNMPPISKGFWIPGSVS